MNVYDKLGNTIQLAEMTDLINPNLLINSDFRSGIINQKGQTSYTNNGSYTIDMWQTTTGIGGNFEVKVNANSITLTNNSTTQDLYFIQRLVLEQDQRTFAVKTKGVSGSVKAYVVNSDGRQGVVSISGDGLFQNTVNVDITNFTILIEKQGSVEIEYVKLEKGQYFTGMPAWNEAIELLKCMRYYQPLYVLARRNAETGTDKYYSIDTMYPVPMVKQPTATVTKVFLTNSQDVTTFVTIEDIGVGSRNIGTLIFGEAHSWSMVKINIELDAYQY